MEICSRKICTGCSACASVCPKNCISMTTDEIGHFFPMVDDKKCISCGKCKAVCPSLNSLEKNMPQAAYAAFSKDRNDYLTSSSGGAASVLSKYIVENGGVVYGCTGTKGYDISHIRVDRVEDLYRLKGSKYVESRMGDTYKNINSDLSMGKRVMLIGTPCQVAGAQQLFGKFDNFYAVELICHGVPPQKLLSEHLNSKVNEEPEEISFREGVKCIIRATHNGKTQYIKNDLFDLYYIGFFKSLYYRQSCYNCKYASQERCSDLTLGDFWGLGKLEKIESDNNGISVVLINSDKGKILFDKIRSKLNVELRSVEEAVNGNPQLRRPSIKHKNTDKFRDLYVKVGFEKAAKRCLIINRIKYVLLAVYNKIRDV